MWFYLVQCEESSIFDQFGFPPFRMNNWVNSSFGIENCFIDASLYENGSISWYGVESMLSWEHNQCSFSTYNMKCSFQHPSMRVTLKVSWSFKKLTRVQFNGDGRISFLSLTLLCVYHFLAAALFFWKKLNILNANGDNKTVIITSTEVRWQRTCIKINQMRFKHATIIFVSQVISCFTFNLSTRNFS